MDLSVALNNFQAEMNRRLDQLELRLINLNELAATSQLNTEINQLNFANLSMTDLPQPVLKEEEVDWDVLTLMIDNNPEEAIKQVINVIRGRLAKKANTKRIIEKANNQYIDSSFLRVSTQLTAKINQRVVNIHTKIQNDVQDIITEVDHLQDHMSQEFGEIRSLINQCYEKKEEAEREAMFSQDQKRATSSMKRNKPNVPLIRRSNTPLLRSKKSGRKANSNISLALKGSTS